MDSAVVLTGASSGIGFASVRALTQVGFHVFAGVRRMDDADRLVGECGERVTPLLFDVTDETGVRDAAAETATRLGNRRLVGLVNNAGIAVAGPLLHMPLDELRRQFEINVVGQIAVTQAFAPLLGTDRARVGPPGRIVNMSSVAGRIVSPLAGAYAASKHALEALSDALRRELMIYGVDVVTIEPGVIATPIWDKIEKTDISPYVATDYRAIAEKMRARSVREGRAGASPERVARAVLRALTAPRPPARIPVVPDYFTKWLLPRALPDRALDAIFARMLGLRAPSR